MKQGRMVPLHQQTTQKKHRAPDTSPIPHTESNRVHTEHAYMERNQLAWIVFIGHPLLSAGHAGSNRSRLAVQRNPCRPQHSGATAADRDRDSSNSVVAVDRRRGVRHVCLTIPAPHRRILIAPRRVRGALRGISGIRALGSRCCSTVTGTVAGGLISCRLSHNRRHTIGGDIVVARKISLLLRLLRRSRGVVGRDHPVAGRSIWGVFLSSGKGFFWGAAESASFGGVRRPVPMLSATGTDAPRNPSSVDAAGTVLPHTLSSPSHGNT
ncbi:hypothetical protein MOQ_002359, partial [Trypanosoma cruzi marinkellei]